MLLSIIIPMYNVELYVERCLRSLLNQDISLEDYEIICINDGSPDKSEEIVRKLQGEYSNILLLNQKNQGVSVARNNGINVAKGDYVLFIDPDDLVIPDCFKRVLEFAYRTKAQVSFLGYSILDENERIIKKVFNEGNSHTIYSGLSAYNISRGDGRSDPDRMWAILFENVFLQTNNLKYMPGVPYLEDGELIVRVLCLAERCVFDGHPFYLRTTRAGSATHSNLFNSDRAIKGFIDSAINLLIFRNKSSLDQQQKEFVNQPIVKFVVLSVTAAITFKGVKKIGLVFSRLKENELSKLELNGCNRFYRKLGLCYNFSPICLFFILSMKSVFVRIGQVFYRNRPN